MSHQCPFPVRSTDSRCGYRAGSVPGLSLCLALVAVLSCFAGFSHAGGVVTAQENQLAPEVGATLTALSHFRSASKSISL